MAFSAPPDSAASLSVVLRSPIVVNPEIERELQRVSRLASTRGLVQYSVETSSAEKDHRQVLSRVDFLTLEPRQIESLRRDCFLRITARVGIDDKRKVIALVQIDNGRQLVSIEVKPETIVRALEAVRANADSLVLEIHQAGKALPERLAQQGMDFSDGRASVQQLLSVLGSNMNSVTVDPLCLLALPEHYRHLVNTAPHEFTREKPMFREDTAPLELFSQVLHCTSRHAFRSSTNQQLPEPFLLTPTRNALPAAPQPPPAIECRDHLQSRTSPMHKSRSLDDKNICPAIQK